MNIIQGDCLEVMRGMPDNTFDAVVTDPPYGLTFMGKDWDRGVPGSHFWEQALRVAKPGAHMLAFGGTRTFHRLTCAIEDAGWEIRDCLMWLCGSGFPKSLDVSKAIDKAAGAERECTRDGVRVIGGYGEDWDTNSSNDRPRFDTPATDLARQWQGWGTALKPAVEYIICAQKPLCLLDICGIMALKIGDSLCQIQSSARDAGAISNASQAEFGAECGSVLWSAAGKCNTPEGLSALMDMLPSSLAGHSCLSIASSWLSILGAICQAENTFTTEMATSLTTDLKILNSFPLETIRESIIKAATNQHGIGSSASLAESILSGARAKLEITLTHSAPGLAISPDGSAGLHPDWTPIILARKPLIGTVAANVEQWGCGGLNIDGCRIETNGEKLSGGGTHNLHEGWGKSLCGRTDSAKAESFGRWPANLAHDGSDDVVTGLDSASRFFYCAKASRADREDGLESTIPAMRNDGRATEIDNPYQRGKMLKNNHPTVKPTSLMRWLVRLVTPPQCHVLDPFCGSGSTGKACALEGMRFTGIELDAAYCDIARARIAHSASNQQLELETTP